MDEDRWPIVLECGPEKAAGALVEGTRLLWVRSSGGKREEIRL